MKNAASVGRIKGSVKQSCAEKSMFLGGGLSGEYC